MSLTARFLLGTVYLLVAVGVVMTYSASAIYAERVYGTPYYFLVRQLTYVAIGTAVLFVSAAIPVRFWRKHARLLVLLAILFLGLVFLPVLGRTAGGAKRWIHLGPVNFQPVEYAKIAVCLYLADYLARKSKWVKTGEFRHFIPPLLIISVICGLTLLQPDLGSCVFIFVIVAILFFWARIRIRYVMLASLVFLPAVYFLVFRVPYRLSRVTAYLNPWEDPQGSGFQMIQSLLAFGIGGLKGVGLGESMQKLFYLPSSYNDFIFSIIGEELGLIGALSVLLLYGVIFLCGIQMAERTDQVYEKLLVIALTLLLVLQALVHMLVTTGLIPTKGLSLPFVSFGGTSLVFSLMAVGLLLGLDRHLRESGR